jgi:formylglycine-generating enzyme required for sulfatase activity
MPSARPAGRGIAKEFARIDGNQALAVNLVVVQRNGSGRWHRAARRSAATGFVEGGLGKFKSNVFGLYDMHGNA